MSKLAVGAGIAKGAENFVNSYLQARAFSQQQQLQKHQIILSALYKNLEDDNIPYEERARIFDAIPGLLGIKLDEPLSHKIGLHQLLENQVETESAKPATSTMGQIGRVQTQPVQAPEVQSSNGEGVSIGVSDSGNDLNTAIVQQGTQAEAAKTTRFGDLSPAKYKQLIINHQQDVDANRALEQYRRKAEVDLELQDKTLKAQGYTREIARGIDSTTGQYTILRANQNGDVKSVSMPKGFVPLEVMVAQTRADASGNKLPASVRAYQAYFENQTNPDTGTTYTSEEAQAKAVEYYKQNGDVMFGLGKAQKEETLTRTKQVTSGTQPISPAEKESIELRKDAAEDRKATQLDTQYGILRDADTQLTNITTNLSSAQEAHNQAQAALNAWIMQNGAKEGDEGLLSGILGKADHSKDTKFTVNGTTYYVDPSDLADDEFKTLNAEVNKSRSEVNKWRAEEARIRGNRESAQQRIRNLESRQAGKSGTSNSASITISDAQIQTFRKNNANNAKVRAMSDDEIREILMRNRNKWQP